MTPAVHVKHYAGLTVGCEQPFDTTPIEEPIDLEADLELLAVNANAVIYPIARCRDPFAGGDCCGVSDDRHEIAVATRLRPQNAEPILRMWKVTRSTSPANTSWVDDPGCQLIGTIVWTTFARTCGGHRLWVDRQPG